MKFSIVTGSDMAALNVYGPFSDDESALAWAESVFGTDDQQEIDWQLVPLQPGSQLEDDDGLTTV